MTKTLNGCSILITRPEAAAEQLAAEIRDHEGLAIVAPMLVIVAFDDPASRARLRAPEEYDAVIFVSPNAVQHAANAVENFINDWQGKAIFAIGPASAAQLKMRGAPTVMTPRLSSDSEGLLALSELAVDIIAGKRILICRGRGGRTKLAEELLARGASVDYAELYERVPACEPLNEILEASQVLQPDVAIVSSGEGLATLAAKIRDEALSNLLGMRLVVPSARIAAQARLLGFTSPPVIVDNLDATALIPVLLGQLTGSEN